MNEIVEDFQWEWGDFDVSYSIGGYGDAGDSGLVALEAFSDPGVHDYIIPLLSGANPDPRFYLWLKVRLPRWCGFFLFVVDSHISSTRKSLIARSHARRKIENKKKTKKNAGHPNNIRNQKSEIRNCVCHLLLWTSVYTFRDFSGAPGTKSIFVCLFLVAFFLQRCL